MRTPPFQHVDSISMTQGRHDLKAGVNYSYLWTDIYFPGTQDGAFVFTTDRPFDANDATTLQLFASSVLAVAPEATGTPILIQESARTVVRAFVQAGALALISITLILFIVLRRASDNARRRPRH